MSHSQFQTNMSSSSSAYTYQLEKENAVLKERITHLTTNLKEEQVFRKQITKRIDQMSLKVEEMVSRMNQFERCDNNKYEKSSSSS